LGARAGQCAECDPDGNDGCDGNTPVCNPDTAACEGCDENGDCGGQTPICTGNGSCQACDPGTSEGCDPNSNRPHCRENRGILNCRACRNDGHCAAVVGAPGGQCLRPAGVCAECDASDNAGCDPASNTPICDAGSDTCRGCNNDDECDDGVCENGSCVECRNNGDCGAELCRNNSCVPCNGGLVPCDNHPYGERCDNGQCGCDDGTDCPPTVGCGNDNRCESCQNDLDCEDNPSGEVCGPLFAGVCGCNDNSECGRRVCGRILRTCFDCGPITPCGDNPNGPECLNGGCGCNTTADCGGRVCDVEVCTDCTIDDDCIGHPRGGNCGAGTAGECGCADVNDCGAQVCKASVCVPCDDNNDCQNHPVGNVCRNGACQQN
jgi:hypothetical protein